MSEKFSNLSAEGKLAKLEQHLDGPHPIPADWVQWVVDAFIPGEVWPQNPSRIETAFDSLNDDQKFEKIAFEMQKGYVPGPWVKWLTDVAERQDLTQSQTSNFPKI
jgi:hypothetical protein